MDDGGNMVTEDLKLLGVRIPTELHQRLKVYAARSGRPMQELVEVAIRQLLDRLEGEHHG